MITFEIFASDKRMRVHLRDVRFYESIAMEPSLHSRVALPIVPSPFARLLETAANRYCDDDDIERMPLLAECVRLPFVRALAYPTIPAPDVLQIFLQSERGPIFACSLVSRARLREMLEREPMIVEGFALQVAPSEHLSIEALRAGVQEWIERGFPLLPLPAITVEVWTGPDGIADDLLQLRLREPVAHLSVDLPDVEPDPSVAIPAFDEDAA